MSEAKTLPPSQWKPAHYEPKGYKFFSMARNQEMMLVFEGPWREWIVYKHPDGQWVSLRKATERDIAELSQAVSNQHHQL